jgi:tetratricopeptide (TPR) repeat protein
MIAIIPPESNPLNNFRGAHYVKAQHYCQECLEISRQAFDEYSIEAGDDNNKLGLSLYHTGQYHKAKEYLHKGLEIRERIFTRNGEDVAESYNNLGELYLKTNDHDRAEYHLETALKIREDIDQLNPSKEAKLDISESYNSLAGLYYEQGKAYDSQNTLLGSRYARSVYEQARSKCEQALKIKIQQLGENHYDVIQNQINLGEIYRKIKNYQAAESVF